MLTTTSTQTSAIGTFVDWYINKMTDFKGTTAELGYRLTSADVSGAPCALSMLPADRARSVAAARVTILRHQLASYLCQISLPATDLPDMPDNARSAKDLPDVLDDPGLNPIYGPTCKVCVPK